LKCALFVFGNLALLSCTCPERSAKAGMVESEPVREVDVEPIQCRWVENYKDSDGKAGDKDVLVIQRAREIGANVIYRGKNPKDPRKMYSCPKILEGAGKK